MLSIFRTELPLDLLHLTVIVDPSFLHNQNLICVVHACKESRLNYRL